MTNTPLAGFKFRQESHIVRPPAFAARERGAGAGSALKADAGGAFTGAGARLVLTAHCGGTVVGSLMCAGGAFIGGCALDEALGDDDAAAAPGVVIAGPMAAPPAVDLATSGLAVNRFGAQEAVVSHWLGGISIGGGGGGV